MRTPQKIPDDLYNAIGTARTAKAAAEHAIAANQTLVKKLRSDFAATGKFINEIWEQRRCDDELALSTGLPPVDRPREEIKRLATAERTKAALPAVIRSAEIEGANAAADLARAVATFSGAVWNLTIAEQADARGLVEAELAALAPSLARLAAISRVREQLCSGPLHLRDVSDERPWCGRTIVNTFIAAIPAKLRGNALNIDNVLREAVEISNHMIAQIEGN